MNLRGLLWFLLILAAGLGARLLVAAAFEGSRDIVLQIHHGQAILAGHSAWTSKLPIAYFLPALMQLAAAKWGIAETLAQKLPAIAGDVFCAILLWKLARRRDHQKPWLWPAVYLLNPVTIILSAYHGNVDPLMAAAMLWALTLRWRDSPVSAGVALSLALTMKPTALLALPVLLLPLSRAGNVRLAVSAVVATVAICAPFALADPNFGAFLANYGGPYGSWGFPLLFKQSENVGRQLLSMEGPAVEVLHGINRLFATYGRHVLVAVIGAALLLLRKRWRISSEEQNASAMAAMYLLFYVFATGFGPQYLSLAAPFLLIGSTRLAVIYSLVLTPFLTGTYVYATVYDKYGLEPITDRLATLATAELALIFAVGAAAVVAWLTCAWIVRRLDAANRRGVPGIDVAAEEPLLQ